MKRLFLIKSPLFKTFLYSIILGIISLISAIPLSFVGYWNIPLGIFVGLLINGGAYLLLYLSEEKESMTHSVKITMLINILRFVVLAIFAFGFAVLEYVFYIKSANVFAIVGGYLASLVIYIIVVLIERK